MPTINDRHRDKNGEIGRKHGNTLASTLRKIYGISFAANFGPEEKLSDLLVALDEESLSNFVKDHQAGTLQSKIAKS